jgi:NAD(P)H-dependent flavin oxidoreductase YrpB (nitropropane dioxygenase family)
MKTRITDLLGIKYPIIQAAATFVAVPRLVAAVSSAGGLGILAPGRFAPDKVRKDIRDIREQTDKPFGVNVVLGAPGSEELVEVAIDERVPIINHARGNPEWLIKATKGHGTIIMATVGALKHAIRAEQDGADAIIVQGLEAGGHTGHIATMVLLPLVASRVRIPVVAAGGFCDGRGLAAALALGADGISMGTRFALTQESGLPWNIKQRYLRSTEADTVVTTRITGSRLRVLQNELTDILEKGRQQPSWRENISSALKMRKTLGVSLWPFLLSSLRMKKVYEASFSDLGNLAAGGLMVRKALAEGDENSGAMPCGQVCGRIDDIPVARELIERIIAEARVVLESLGEKILS